MPAAVGEDESMGQRRKSTRTLPNGDQVVHHPPTDQHPDGQQVLIRNSSPLRDRLTALRPAHQAQHRDLHVLHHRQVAIKKHRQRGLPNEKSCV